VAVQTTRANGQVEIRVSDNGPGIPEEIRQKIFEPFFTTKPAGQGTGLGLSLSYDIVTQGHGGSISVASRKGGGAAFTLLLPA
jgi:signal transduction histidine kinase